MRIIIDIRDDLIVRWGSLFIHPLSYNAEEVRMYIPGFEQMPNQQQGAQVFSIKIAPDQQQIKEAGVPQAQLPTMPMAQLPTMPMQPGPPSGMQQPQLPQDYPPPQPPSPFVPPQVMRPPGVSPQELRGEINPLSQQPTPSLEQPLSIVTPDKEKGLSHPVEDGSPGDQKGEDDQDDIQGNVEDDKT